MVSGVAVMVLMGLPILIVLGLLELSAWRERVRVAAIEWQIALTDAIAEELGAVVAPVVRRGLWGPWRVEIPVPWARVTIVGRVLTTAHRVFSRTRRPYELVITPQDEPTPARVSAGARRLETRAA
jgi:hypothetical protein